MTGEAGARGRSAPAAGRSTSTRWTRDLAMRIAMGGLFGFDPDRSAPTRSPSGSRAGSASTAASSRCSSCSGPALRWRACSATGGARGARRRRDPAAARARRGGHRHPRLPARGDRRGGQLAQRRAGPRSRADAALRRPRHDDLDDQLPRLRARPQSGVGRPPSRGGDDVPGRGAEPGAALRRAAAADPRCRRDAAHVSAGLARPAPRRSATSSSTVSGCRPGIPTFYSSWVSHRLPHVFERPNDSTPTASSRSAGRVAPRRLRPLRDGTAGLHRQALRLHRGPRDRRGAGAAIPLRAAGRARAGSSRRRRSRRRAACRCGCSPRLKRALARRARTLHLGEPGYDRRVCRLFALHSDHEDVAADFWLLEAPDSLASQSESNADGFGLAALTANDGLMLIGNPVRRLDVASTTRVAAPRGGVPVHRASPLRRHRQRCVAKHAPVPPGRAGVRAQRSGRRPRAARGTGSARTGRW